MPLHKSPPPQPPTIDPQAAKRRHLQERRRTLQTISELSVTDGTTPNFAGSKSPRPNDMPGPPGVSAGGRKTSHMNKRRSLPQYCARPECNATFSTIPMSPMHITGVQRLRSESGVHGTSTSLYEAGWNARRERARMRTEQALVGTQMKSNHSASNLRVSSLPTSPTVSPSPRAKASRPELRPYSSQQQLLRNSLSTKLSSQSKRQSDLDFSTKLNTDFGNDPGSSRRTSSDSSSFHSTHESLVRRSRSGSSITSYTSQEVPPMPTGRSISAQRVNVIPTSTNDIAAVHIPISVHTRPRSVPRMYSSPLNDFDHHRYYGKADGNVHISSLARVERKQLSNRRSSSGRRLTDTSLDLQRSSLGRHASYTAADQSQQDVALNALHEINAIPSPRPSQPIPTQRQSRSRSSLKAASPISTPPPAYSPSSVSDLIYNQTPDKVGLSLPIDTNLDKRSIPNRESLIRWKSEREEARAEFDGMQRAKVKERVRRANELEQEKEKELQELGKGNDKAARVLGKGLKTKKRGCFGGLFGRVVSKVLRLR